MAASAGFGGGKPRRIRARRVLLGVLAALVACSSADLSRTEFVAKADRICAEFEQKLTALQIDFDPFQESAGEPERRAATDFFQAAAGGFPELAASISKLEQPAEDEHEVELLTSSLASAGAAFERARSAYEAGDMATARAAVAEANGLVERAGALGQEYGFAVCGRRAVPDQPPAAGGEEIAVVATEYRFEIAASPAAGPTTFVIENRGSERHVFALAKLAPGAAAADLVGSTSDAAVEREIGQSEAAAPGDTVRFNAHIEPGAYAYACFVVAPDGETHASKRMLGEFTVPVVP